MRLQHDDQVKPTTARHFPSLAGRSINPNVHIFVRDLQLAIMPIGGKTDKRKGFRIDLEGESGDCERVRGLLAELGHRNRRDLAELVSGAIQDVATHLAWEGCAGYEIMIRANQIVQLHSFTTKRLIRLPRLFLQLIPRGDWELWQKKVIAIPASRVWYLEMPRVLGGRKGYKRALRKLAKFAEVGPAFWRQDLEHGEQTTPFDFQLYVKTTEIYFRRVTKPWGWNRRDWSQQWAVEFFNFYRMITFRWAQAVLREHIVAELNRLFRRLGMACALRITGLPTSSEILTVREQLEEGTISFAKASDRVSV